MIQNILCFLEESARKHPDKPAFADEHSSLSYQQLLDKSRCIGSFLAMKTKPRRPIPILAEKSTATVAVFMGILSAGCFYVLLDPNQPSARLAQILDTLQPELLIADSNSLKTACNLSFSGKILDIKSLTAFNENTALLDQIRSQTLDTDPLYAIFTSGSTGIPKGVIVCHRSVIDFIEHFTNLFHITDEDIIGNQAPFDFDVSVKDIYATLKSGATMEIIPKRLFSIPTGLLDYLCEKKVTTAIWAVSALCIITTLNGFTYRVPSHLNKILFSGEVMPVKHLNIWRQHLPNALFVNLYGPTEITCNCTYFIINRNFLPGDALPIGIPFPNESVLLLDEGNQLITESQKMGELCVLGTALALGYYGDDPKTNLAFVQNPLNNHYPEKMYRTGDLAHYGKDNMLYFDTRKDFQIKHMGHRIELGEIEAALDTIEGVNRAVCIYLEAKNKIAAFYEGTADKKTIVLSLGEWLPRYMIPNIFKNLQALPVTKNGKIDRQKLREDL